MERETTLFQDIMQGLSEIEAYEKGELDLKETVIELDETEEFITTQSLHNKIHMLTFTDKIKAIQYVDELLQAVN